MVFGSTHLQPERVIKKTEEIRNVLKDGFLYRPFFNRNYPIGPHFVKKQ